MLGLYVSVPFCRSKCSYCNFASDVFAPAMYREYGELLERELDLAVAAGGLRGGEIDSIYWGGGTPTLLPPASWMAIAKAIATEFRVAADCEHTVEAAPGTLTDEIIGALVQAGVNRVSLGVQSFVDAEARAVGRLHRAATVFDDVRRLRAAGIVNLNVDLIAGLPHQSEGGWRESLAAAVELGVPHVSVYMLEIDEESRLGSELLAGGSRYHAHFVPDSDLTASLYETACEQLESQGLGQYEISNFARPGFESRHNERYWLRRPYLGLGVDAHSFFIGTDPRRFANTENLGEYMGKLREGKLARGEAHALTPGEAVEETLFLGLRRAAGVDLDTIAATAGGEAALWIQGQAAPLVASGLLAKQGSTLRLTAHGRLLSNNVFAEFLGVPTSVR